MNVRYAGWLGIAAAVVALSAVPLAWADHQQVVRGTTVNIGVVPATTTGYRAVEAGADRLPSGSQLLTVSLADATTGRYIEAKKVSVELRDPKGRVQKKDLQSGRTGDIPDYYETFVFGWSGQYRIRVTAESLSGKPPVVAEFRWDHVVD